MTESEMEGIREAEALRQAPQAGVSMEEVLAEFSLRVSDFRIER